jgi:hypothetical protein
MNMFSLLQASLPFYVVNRVQLPAYMLLADATDSSCSILFFRHSDVSTGKDVVTFPEAKE